ncbi:MAG: CotH kinase family protein [Bacteroidaceae bacterium]|nr:CotH kinase family protein [Bacteroidaceae bacterium]
MKNKVLTAGLLCLLATAARAQKVVINEIMACNVDVVLDPSINYGSWMELYNAGTEDFSLEGLYVTDDSLDLKKFRLNERADDNVVPAKGFKAIYFDHHDVYAPWQVDFKLSYEGGLIMLTDGEQVIASQTYPQAIGRTSYARRTNGGNLWATTYTPTPGASNAGSKFATRQLAAPVFDVETAFVSSGQQVSLKATAGATIRYTTDGSTPTPDHGQEYKSPLELKKNTVVRARAFRTGYLPSEVTTRTFITDGKAYVFPIVSVATDDDNLHDWERGLFEYGPNGRPGNGQSWNFNGNMDWDRPANFEYILLDGSQAVNQEVDMAMCGGWSRAWTPHSFKLKAAKYYMGKNTLDYDFFSDSKPGLKHRVLQVRNGGNDTSQRLKDAALQELVRRSGLYVDGQAWKPVHVFLNGSYYAVLNMREPNNKRYAQTNYNIDPDQMDQFEIGPDSGYVQMTGTEDKFLEWYELSANAADPAVYQQICQMVDIDEYINYMAVELYLNNTDWPQNNVKGFRDREDGKFHFVIFDLDFAFANDGEGSSPSPFITFANKKNHTFSELYGKYDYYYNPETDEYDYVQVTPWATGDRIKEEIKFVTIFLQMLQNEQFRRQFVDTYCIVGGSVFDPTRVKEIVNEMRDYMNLGMGLTGANCNNSAANITSKLSSTRQLAMFNTLKAYTPMGVKSTKAVTLNLSSYIRNEEGKQVAFDGGRIIINNVEVPTGKMKGKMFHPLTVKALAPAGYKFEGWTDLTGKNLKAPYSQFEVPANLTTVSYRATWVKMTDEELAEAGLTPSPVVVNEVSASNGIYVSDYFKRDDWVELYNTTDEDIDLAGCYLTDNAAKPQKYQIPTDDPALCTVIPAHGYLQVWCDKLLNIGSAIHASFKLAKEGGIVMLSKYDESGQLLYSDQLEYTEHGPLQTYGRYPDAALTGTVLERPTPLARNVNTPSVLSAYAGLLGDLDDDGRITVEDISLLIATYLDPSQASIYLPRYDIDGDGQLTVSDITTLVNIYLGEE